MHDKGSDYVENWKYANRSIFNLNILGSKLIDHPSYILFSVTPNSLPE